MRVARTRRTISEAGFFMTRNIMTDVATESAYLRLVNKPNQSKIGSKETYQVKMYWAWLFRRFTSAARPTGIPRASYSIILIYSGSTLKSQHNCLCTTVEEAHKVPTYPLSPLPTRAAPPSAPPSASRRESKTRPCRGGCRA